MQRDYLRAEKEKVKTHQVIARCCEDDDNIKEEVMIIQEVRKLWLPNELHQSPIDT